MRACIDHLLLHAVVQGVPNQMATKRRVEVFSAGCVICQGVIDAVRQEAGSSDEVIVRSMYDSRVIERAKKLGIQCVPAVVIDDKLVSCPGPGVNIQALKAAGLGNPL